ncbi:UPF0058 family protein [Halopenitus sp. H-Gu1]|uniref:UPF0058 family protein n=1 Tax=Halopenitus sp. H-Gu1 TaxID=3242697 RepID=UPI00359EBFA4
MQKNELIHVHNLLGTLSRELHDEGHLESDDLRTYRELGTSPMTMHGSRAEHAEAVIELADALAGAVNDDPEIEDEADRAVTV